jgi:hypothetical protein
MSENTDSAQTGATASVTARPSALPVWLIATIAGFFGLFYAYAVWNAVAFLVSQASGPLGLNGGGWALLLTAAAFPIIVFALAFATGWKRRAGAFALIMLSGLGIVAVFWMNVLAYAAVYGASLLGG